MIALAWMFRSSLKPVFTSRYAAEECTSSQLQEFHFHTEHRPGIKHQNADALSRIPCQQCGFLCSRSRSEYRLEGTSEHPGQWIVQ